jgi:hypothetical protein
VGNNVSAATYQCFLSLNPWSPERTTLSQAFLVGLAVGILQADSPPLPALSPPPLPLPSPIADPGTELEALQAFKVSLAEDVRPSKRIPYTACDCDRACV